MNAPWSLIGSAVGIVGLLVAVAAILFRLAGHYYVGGFEALTLFQAGVGLLVTGCFCKLHDRPSR